MFCQKCGNSNDDNAFKCMTCGHILQSVTSSQQGLPYVPNYLLQAILVTLFCCVPFGIVAIVFAAQVNGKLNAGDLAGARQSSESAKTWCWISFWIGIIVGVLWVLLVIAAEL